MNHSLVASTELIPTAARCDGDHALYFGRRTLPPVERDQLTSFGRECARDVDRIEGAELWRREPASQLQDAFGQAQEVEGSHNRFNRSGVDLESYRESAQLCDRVYSGCSTRVAPRAGRPTIMRAVAP